MWSRPFGTGCGRWPGGLRDFFPGLDRRGPGRARRNKVFAPDLGTFTAMDSADPRRRNRDVAAAQGGADRVAISPPPAGRPASLLRLPGFRPQLWPTLFTVPVLLLCLGLGSWQIQRLFWKEELIAQRQAAVSAAPVAVPLRWAEAQEMEFRRVTAEGVFLNDKEIFLGATSEAGGQGYQVLTPLREPGGRIIFVNRGYIRGELKDPAKRIAGQISGSVRV